MTTRYLHTPVEIATALRTIADRLDAMTPAVLPALSVGLDIQVCAWSTDDQSARIGAVDAMARAILDLSGQTRRLKNGKRYHTTPYTDDTLIAGIDVSVYTADIAAPKRVAA